MASHGWKCHLALRSFIKCSIFNDLYHRFLNMNIILSYDLK